MSNRQKICYENMGCKIKWDNRNLDSVKIMNPYKEFGYCYGEKGYIQQFIENIKTNVIKGLPDLSKVRFKLGIFDKNNILHQLIVKTYYMLANVLKVIQKIDVYNTIFVIVLYEGNIVFTGSLSFNKIK